MAYPVAAARAFTEIQRATAEYFDISLESLRNAPGSGRNNTIATARHVARYLERQRGLSLPEIGELYGCDHTTVLASVRHMEERVRANDPRYAKAVPAIADKLKMKHGRNARRIAARIAEIAGENGEHAKAAGCRCDQLAVEVEELKRIVRILYDARTPT